MQTGTSNPKRDSTPARAITPPPPTRAHTMQRTPAIPGEMYLFGRTDAPSAQLERALAWDRCMAIRAAPEPAQTLLGVLFALQHRSYISFKCFDGGVRATLAFRGVFDRLGDDPVPRDKIVALRAAPSGLTYAVDGAPPVVGGADLASELLHRFSPYAAQPSPRKRGRA